VFIEKQAGLCHVAMWQIKFFQKNSITEGEKCLLLQSEQLHTGGATRCEYISYE
jgi:hypothetical protein